MKVLAVEDDALVSLEFAQLIRTMGHEPIMASSGEEALRLPGLHEPDVVLMDVRIAVPLEDEIEVAKEIPSRHKCSYSS